MMKSMVVKLGTQVVIKDGSLSPLLTELMRVLQAHIQKGFSPILVSSGAVGLGRQELSWTGELSLNQKQAAAAVGQGLLIHHYRNLASQSQLKVAQVLLTADDFSHRDRFLNLKSTFEELLKAQVLPIVNENDSVSVRELNENSQGSFGDNDLLSSIVAAKLESKLLVILSGVDGVYDKNPQIDSLAKKIEVIESLNELDSISTIGTSVGGRGGMITKLQAAKLAALSGVPTLITSLPKFLENNEAINLNKLDYESLKSAGTIVLPQKIWNGKKKWIATATGFKGVLIVNEGATHALLQRKASLLRVGITDVRGDFSAGDVVSIRSGIGIELGRGISRYGSNDILKSDGVVVHRDELSLWKEEKS